MKTVFQTFTKDLVGIIYDLDKIYYGDVCPKTWYNRYVNKSNIALLKDDEQIVGYLIIANISEVLFNEIKSLKHKGDINFNASHFVKESEYVYLSSILILDNYRNKGYYKQLMNFVPFKNKKVITICVSQAGEHVINKYLTFIGNNEQSKIYSN